MSCKASLLWMKDKFLFRIHIWYQYLAFFNIALSCMFLWDKCIATFGHSLRFYSFIILFIHSTFLLCSFRFHVLLQNWLVAFLSDGWFVFVHCQTTCWQHFFRYFRKSSFACIAWPCPRTFRQYIVLFLPKVCNCLFRNFLFIVSLYVLISLLVSFAVIVS